MGSFSVWHWLIVLVIVMLVFGTKKIGSMGSDLGKAVKGFKDGVKSGGEVTPESGATPTQQVTATNKAADPNTVDVEAKTKT